MKLLYMEFLVAVLDGLLHGNEINQSSPIIIDLFPLFLVDRITTDLIKLAIWMTFSEENVVRRNLTNFSFPAK